MQIEFKLKRILPVFFGLAFLWTIFIVSTFILSEKENPNHEYVPANSAFVLRLDAKSFFESAAYDIFYASQDQEIFRRLKSFQDADKNQSRIRDAGIDLLSDVIVFSQEQENGQIVGILLNLTNADKFNEKMSAMLSENQSFASSEAVGIIVTSIGAGQVDQKKLKILAENWLASKNKTAGAQKWLAGKQDFLNLEVKGFQNDKLHIGPGSIGAQLNNSLLAFQGDFKMPEKPLASAWTLKPDGFHLSAYVFNRSLQDSLKGILVSRGFDFPRITKISVNYRGTSLDGGIIPQADLLLEFESDVDRKQLDGSLGNWQVLGFTGVAVAENEFLLTKEDAAYTLLILDNKTIFIGLNKKNVSRSRNENLFLLKGDLTRLTATEGGGLAALGLNLYPPYKASKQFFEAVSIANIDFSPKKGKLVLDGKIEFREGKYPVSESLKFFLAISN